MVILLFIVHLPFFLSLHLSFHFLSLPLGLSVSRPSLSGAPQSPEVRERAGAAGSGGHREARLSG